MNAHYVLYDPSNGRILSRASCSPEALPQLLSFHNTESYLQTTALTEHCYVDLQTLSVVAQQANPMSVNGNVLSNVPVPSTLKIEGASYEVTESSVTVEMPTPGRYRFRLTPHDPQFPSVIDELEVA